MSTGTCWKSPNGNPYSTRTRHYWYPFWMQVPGNFRTDTRTQLVLVARVPVSDVGTRVQVQVQVPVSNECEYSSQTSTTRLRRV
jgi:hypothetical protein